MKIASTRKASEKDLNLTFEIKKAALQNHIIQTFGPWKEDWQLAEHRKDFSSGQFEIITVHGMDVGYIWTRRTAHTIYLVDICILPEHQGTGIGTQIITMVLSEAKAAHLPVELGVFKNNHSALNLYTRLGFKKISETPTHVLMKLLPQH